MPSDEGIADRWYAHWIAEGFRGFEACLVREGRSETYCLGDTLGVADIGLVPQVANARRLNCDLSAYPATVAIADRVADLPAVRRVAPADRF